MSTRDVLAQQRGHAHGHRNDARLASLAAQHHRRGLPEVDVCQSDVQEFLHARARVVEHGEQTQVSESSLRLHVNRSEDGRDGLGRHVLDNPRLPWFLERDRRHVVPDRNRAYITRRGVGEEPPDRVESEVPRRDGAFSLVLEMVEKIAD